LGNYKRLAGDYATGVVAQFIGLRDVVARFIGLKGCFRMKKPVIAIIGRPNVGKSTLFNRILGKRIAIVEDTPGVTRDRNYAVTSYLGRDFILVDTGGLEPETSDPILTQMRRQADTAIDEADIIIFLMDGREGLMPADLEIADILRKIHKPVFYAINKVDSNKAEAGISDFYRLSAEKLYLISAEHGRCVDELLDDLQPLLPETGEEGRSEGDEAPPRIAVVGKPNVGKSTLINRLLGKERLVTSPMPGTTRDAIDTLVTYYKKGYLFVDTAGIRRKARVDKGIESYSVIRALKSIERCNIAILLIDAAEGITDQDLKILKYIEEAEKGCIIGINKWDIVEKDEKTMDQYKKSIYSSYPYISHIPIIFISALTGNRVAKLFPEIRAVMEEYSKRIPTGELNRFTQEIAGRFPASTYQGRPVKIYYATQTGVRPPGIVLFVNYPKAISPSIRRFIEHNIRDQWGFKGVPLRIMVREKSR
jgi:GTP-binding protein